MGMARSGHIRAHFGLSVGQITWPAAGGLSAVPGGAVDVEKLYNVLPFAFVHMAAAFQNI